ncbi:MAG: MipA/OmpV family protein [Helicobacteraceae bacterium]|jgi:outer membrane scaffolding protein for murein synthesis (MipA/OmpV family)|nr:MipA/OmpV family protein [Helicobacteraceae bacterium]
MPLIMSKNLAAFVLASLTRLIAFADDNVSADRAAPIDANQTKRSDFRYSIGFGAANLPYFDASSDSRWRVLPFGDLRYKSLFLSPIKGAGVDLPIGVGASFSPAISYRAERDESDDDALKGLGDASAEATYGASIGFARPAAILGASAFRGFSSGATAYRISVAFPFRPNENWTIAPAFSAQFGDRKYNQTYYGISAAQSANSRYDRYNPSGGATDVSVSLAISRRVTPTVSVNLFARHKRFVDQAADSPLIKAEGDSQNNFGAMIVYSPRR